MERLKHNNVIFYQFDSLRHLPGLNHAIFTRHGGISPSPFDSLNVGATVGDAYSNVQANRQRMAGVLGIQEAESRTAWQVHGADVIAVRQGEPSTSPPPQGDGLITDDPGVPLVMRFADCVPILLYDPVQRAIGMAHAGWRGTVQGIGPATVRAMERTFGSRPEDIVCGIGPAIGPCCYEVGPEVIAAVHSAFPHPNGLIVSPVNGGRSHFDLWAANERALREAGVENVEVAGLCTSCHNYEFFSHRAEAGRTGRFGAIVVMQDEEAA
jgi:YfiH family protein